MVIATFAFACKEKPKNPVAEYGDVMMNSYEKGKQAGEIANLDAVRKAVQAFHAAHDKYPATLDEISPMIGSDLDFSKYDYNPETGAVAVKPR